jgi:hypothetical protein
MNPLQLDQADVVVTLILEVSGARRRVIGDRRCILERAAVLYVRGDVGRAKPVFCATPNGSSSVRLRPIFALAPVQDI